MDNRTARLLIGDPAAIMDLRRELGDDQAFAELANIRNEIPATVTPIANELASLLANPNLHLNPERGVIELTVAPNELAPESATSIAEDAVKIFTACDKAHNIGRWVLGNIAHLLEEAGQPMDELVEGTKSAYNTIVTSRTTFKFFEDRRYRLPFSHHKEIAYAKDLTKDQKHAIALFAEDADLTLTQTRSIIRVTQQCVRDGNEPEHPATIYATIETPTTAGHRFLVITGGASAIVDQRPDQREMEAAEEVYEVRAILKEPERRGVEDAERAVPPNEQAGPPPVDDAG